MDNEIIREKSTLLFKSVQNMLVSSGDLSALYGSVYEEIEAGFEGFGQIKKLFEEDDCEINGRWIKSYAEMAWKVNDNDKRKKTPIWTVTVIIRLCGKNEVDIGSAKWPWVDQACIIVGWHTGVDDLWANEFFGLEHRHWIHHRGNGVWAWDQGEGDYAYFFALPIFALANQADIKQYIVEPLKALCQAEDPLSVAESIFESVPVLIPVPA